MDDGVKIKMRLGKTGSGKTLDQTEEDVLPALLDEQEVWSCYWLNWNRANWHYFKPRDFEKIKDLRNCMVVFDELRQSFDPRRYDDETEEVRAFFELHRHRHNDIVGNTQDVSLVAKTVGIQAHEWILCEKVEEGALMRWLIGERIAVQKDFLTFQELKKMANGWELGEDVALDNDWERKNYRIKDIIHHELDDYKIELIHKYCPRCKMRQGKQILKEDTEKVAEKVWLNKKKYTWVLKEIEMCPRHHDTQLEIRESAMFDTDYEPETTEKSYRLVKYEMCKTCGKEHPVK